MLQAGRVGTQQPGRVSESAESTTASAAGALPEEWPARGSRQEGAAVPGKAPLSVIYNCTYLKWGVFCESLKVGVIQGPLAPRHLLCQQLASSWHPSDPEPGGLPKVNMDRMALWRAGDGPKVLVSQSHMADTGQGWQRRGFQR